LPAACARESNEGHEGGTSLLAKDRHDDVDAAKRRNRNRMRRRRTKERQTGVLDRLDHRIPVGAGAVVGDVGSRRGRGVELLGVDIDIDDHCDDETSRRRRRRF
jgi:hypothetical protein